MNVAPLRPFRFSVRAVLWGTAVLALLIANLLTSLKLREAVRQRDALRQEVGFLDDSEPEKIAAVRVPSDEPLRWKFRVRVPAGQKYRMAFGTLWPREATAPQWIAAQAIPEGESLVTVRLVADPRDDQWKCILVLRHDDSTFRVAAPLTPRQIALFRHSTDTMNLGIGADTATVAAGHRLRVMDLRWIGGEGGLLLYGNRPPDTDMDGVFAELQPDDGPLVQ